MAGERFGTVTCFFRQVLLTIPVLQVVPDGFGVAYMTGFDG